MRTLGLISSGIALLGILAYSVLKDAAPTFIVPMVIVSTVLAIFFILVGSLASIRTSSKKSYQCIQCGLNLTGKRLKKADNLCPMCGGNVFA
jgi:DNA-directed RNA polymerase subunit RPC12/RpoP